MSTKPVPKRWTDALSPGDPLREALLAARAEVPDRDRLERVYGTILAAGGGLGGDGSGDDGGDLGDGGDGGDLGDLPGGELHPDGPGPELPPIVVPPVPAPIAAAGLGAAGLASTGLGSAKLGTAGGSVLAALGTTTLGKTIGVGLIGSASIATALWIAAPAAAPVEAPRARTVEIAPASSAPAPDEARPPAVMAPAAEARPATTAAPAGSTSAAAPADDPDAEIALLREAQAAVSGAPVRALALLDESERRFPRSALAQERVVIRVQALLGAGRRGEALERARAFVAANPGTAHRPRLEQLLPELTL